MEGSIKVAVVDDQSIIREGLATMIDLDEAFEVVVRARHGLDLIEYVDSFPVDFILLDIDMPKMNGLQTLKELKNMEITAPVLMLTIFSDDHYILEAMRLGASGYVLKDMEIERLLSEMKKVLNGYMVFPESVKQKLIDVLSQQQNTNIRLKEKLLEKQITITDREEEILSLLALGYTNQRIADTIYLSVGTVKNYCSRLYDKLEMNNRAELVSYLHQLLKV
ncbi:response regulator [Gracilibacillus timonensis]|uniref:response regulator n=1 Tax=Gracilibacillus timonensis TaxID=1816696 RepID=UPI00082472F0|nr:response regulator transcription factor [Gracilibacillus timonensis]